MHNYTSPGEAVIMVLEVEADKMFSFGNSLSAFRCGFPLMELTQGSGGLRKNGGHRVHSRRNSVRDGWVNGTPSHRRVVRRGV